MKTDNMITNLEVAVMKTRRQLEVPLLPREDMRTSGEPATRECAVHHPDGVARECAVCCAMAR